MSSGARTRKFLTLMSKAKDQNRIYIIYIYIFYIIHSVSYHPIALRAPPTRAAWGALSQMWTTTPLNQSQHS